MSAQQNVHCLSINLVILPSMLMDIKWKTGWLLCNFDARSFVSRIRIVIQQILLTVRCVYKAALVNRTSCWIKHPYGFISFLNFLLLSIPSNLTAHFVMFLFISKTSFCRLPPQLWFNKRLNCHLLLLKILLIVFCNQKRINVYKGLWN